MELVTICYRFKKTGGTHSVCHPPRKGESVQYITFHPQKTISLMTLVK